MTVSNRSYAKSTLLLTSQRVFQSQTHSNIVRLTYLLLDLHPPLGNARHVILVAEIPYIDIYSRTSLTRLGIV